ncbi:MAG: histidine--tRNA ligase [Hyphomonadaceae bacterium]|nr:histidine--tRNA ligase [Hyphomonadaceae bacterium]
MPVSSTAIVPMPDPKDFRPKARRPRGFQDRRGPGLKAERALVAKISAVYEAWGFEPLETGAFEYADALGKFLPDQDRPNEGVFALEDDDAQWMALRYDLTAPLARFVAENFDQLPKPYRRWAAGPVWRNEKPGPGRFREFWQCDADTVGSPSPAADAEMIAMACEAYGALGLQRAQYQLKYNDRRLLDALLESIGAPATGEGAQQRLRVLRAIDKLDRLGAQGVSLLLREGRKDESGDFTEGAKLSADGAKAVMDFVEIGLAAPKERVGKLERLFAKSEGLQAVYRELAILADILSSLVDAEQAAFDPSVVRGLEYYTGPVFEAELLGDADEAENKIRYGSIGGGGRYDDLVARFTGQKIPATGFSIGVSRLAAALEKQAEAADGPIVVLPFDKEGMADCFGFAKALRAAGLRAEVYLGGSGPKAQLKYADKRNAPVAVILGGDERRDGTVTLKGMKLGAEMAKNVSDNKEWREGRPAQSVVKQADLVASVQRMLTE